MGNGECPDQSAKHFARDRNDRARACSRSRSRPFGSQPKWRRQGRWPNCSRRPDDLPARRTGFQRPGQPWPSRPAHPPSLRPVFDACRVNRPLRRRDGFTTALSSRFHPRPRIADPFAPTIRLVQQLVLSRAAIHRLIASSGPVVFDAPTSSASNRESTHHVQAPCQPARGRRPPALCGIRPAGVFPASSHRHFRQPAILRSRNRVSRNFDRRARRHRCAGAADQ